MFKHAVICLNTTCILIEIFLIFKIHDMVSVWLEVGICYSLSDPITVFHITNMWWGHSQFRCSTLVVRCLFWIYDLSTYM